MGLKQAILKSHQILRDAGVDHALIGGLSLAVHGIKRATGEMTFMEYLDFLDQYWEIFGPPVARPDRVFTRVLFSNAADSLAFEPMTDDPRREPARR
jgi:hypothetical protein